MSSKLKVSALPEIFIIKRMKRQATYWKKIFESKLSDKGVLPTHIKISQNLKENNPILKIDKQFEHLTKPDMQMVVSIFKDAQHYQEDSN